MRSGKFAAYSAMLCGAFLAIAPLRATAQGAAPSAVTGTNVNLRQGPGTSYTVITLIPAGAPVNVSGCNAGWCQVSFQGQNGYIIASAIAPAGAVVGSDAPVLVAPGAPPPGHIPPPRPYYYGGYYGPYYGRYGYGPGPYWRGRYYYRPW